MYLYYWCFTLVHSIFCKALRNIVRKRYINVIYYSYRIYYFSQLRAWSRGKNTSFVVLAQVMFLFISNDHAEISAWFFAHCEIPNSLYCWYSCPCLHLQGVWHHGKVEDPWRSWMQEPTSSWTTGGIDDLCLKYFVEAGAMAVRRCRKQDPSKRILSKATGQVQGDEGTEHFSPYCSSFHVTVTLSSNPYGCFYSNGNQYFILFKHLFIQILCVTVSPCKFYHSWYQSHDDRKVRAWCANDCPIDIQVKSAHGSNVMLEDTMTSVKTQQF